MANMPIGYIILEGAPSEIPDATIVKESDKRVIGEGIIQTAEEENRNGRCYLQPDLLREVQCARTKELLTTGNMLSENGHPMDPSDHINVVSYSDSGFIDDGYGIMYNKLSDNVFIWATSS